MGKLEVSKRRVVYYTIMFFDGDWNEIPELHRDYQTGADLVEWVELFNEAQQAENRGSPKYHPYIGTARCMGLEVHYE